MWAIPTLRAIYESYKHSDGEPPHITFMTSRKYGDPGFLRLLQQGIGVDVAIAHSCWEVVETAPMTPREPPEFSAKYDKTYHLGLTGWPDPDIPWNVYSATNKEADLPLLNLETPWILPPNLENTQDTFGRKLGIAVGFTDEWVELKMGVLLAVLNYFRERGVDVEFYNIRPKVSRHDEWDLEFRDGVSYVTGWLEAAATINNCSLFFGCCSALWVLARGLGKRCVMMEPSEPRWNPVFWPSGGRWELIKGNDGRPTFDARTVSKRVFDSYIEEITRG